MAPNYRARRNKAIQVTAQAPEVIPQVRIINNRADVGRGIHTVTISRKILVDFSNLADDYLQQEAMTPMVDLHLPRSVPGAPLEIIIEWMRKTHTKRPTKPLAISDIEKSAGKLDYDIALIVYDIIQDVFSVKARAITGELHKWMLVYIQDSPLTVAQVAKTWALFNPEIGLVQNMAFLLAQRGMDVYSEEEQQSLTALLAEEPDLNDLVEHWKVEHAAFAQREARRETSEERKKQSAEQRAGWAKERECRKARQAAREARAQVQAQRVALARDGLRPLSEEEVNLMMRR